MKLITETIFEGAKSVISEGANGEKEYFIEGIFMQDTVKNRNGRVYPKPVMEAQLKVYNETFVSRNRALGELGHPENPSVNLERVSHNIVSLNYGGTTDIYGKAKLMDTPYGSIAKSFVREGIELGVSTRGLGSLRESSGAKVVQNDFILTAVDIVADPSAPKAFVNGIMESREWIIVDGVLTEQELGDLKSEIDTQTSKFGALIAENNVMKMMENIKNRKHNLGTGRVNSATGISAFMDAMTKEIMDLPKDASPKEIQAIKDKYVSKITAWKKKTGNNV